MIRPTIKIPDNAIYSYERKNNIILSQHTVNVHSRRGTRIFSSAEAPPCNCAIESNGNSTSANPYLGARLDILATYQLKQYSYNASTISTLFWSHQHPKNNVYLIIRDNFS
jgi:hypothetical protein